MILVADVGNTNIVFGLYKNDELINYWRFATTSVKTSDEVGMFLTVMFNKWELDPKQLRKVVISSVVPNIMYSLINGVQKYLKIDPIVVSTDMNSNIKLTCMKNPNELGADRLVNAVGAYEKYGGPVMIIDYGTATTYDVVSQYGEFITGITAPGLKISSEALFNGTALLGKVEIKATGSLITTDTIESVQAGLVYGHIGQSEYMVNKIKEELGVEYDDMKIIATGGFSKVINEGTDIFTCVDKELTLDGIKLIGEMN